MRLKLLLLVLGLQTAWIVGTAISHERSLVTGRVVTLETVPVDPRDWLRGDYVTLGYKISRLPTALLAGSANQTPTPGAPVYVALEKQGGFYEAARASTSPIEPASGEVIIRGHAVSSWDSKTLRVEYGIERYYVREGSGNPLGKLTVKV